jgi:hypothetical protein
MSSTLPFNVSLLGLNTNAKEFKPQFNVPTFNISSPNSSQDSNKIQDENKFFDHLEKDFIKNNEWLFFV